MPCALMGASGLMTKNACIAVYSMSACNVVARDTWTAQTSSAFREMKFRKQCHTFISMPTSAWQYLAIHAYNQANTGDYVNAQMPD